MNITLLSVNPSSQPSKKPGGSPVVFLDIAYKNNSFGGKVEGKKIFGFGASKAAFDTLAVAQPGTTVEVEVKKNDAGFNDWVAVTSAGVVAQAPQPSAGKPPVPSATGSAPRSNFETPEERAQRQVFIIRQSSISAAVATASVGAKKLEPADVLKVAKAYEDYVLGVKSPGASGFDDLPDFPKDLFPEVN